ncbi:PHP domain-containing protein [Scandinavium sp. H11S7]|uniref:PHP domain-containing protein n=1 Tax=Scandinavium hiltneri TaxID=2926519 RepID=A0ABT2DXH1_9ENTR|nr:PHP domain-containing protein [Scandinavium hiltneri]MCS2159883.1 PHP domain-containing protein [Scandinavium hiltneri]
MENIDLHIHSSYSDDADYDVNHIMRMSNERHMSLISITDHNSAKSATEILRMGGGKRPGFINGIEIDCCFNNHNFHVLGYGYTNTSDFDYIEDNFIELQKNATPLKIMKLKALGFHLNEDALYENAKGKIPQEEEMAELILHDVRNSGNALLLPYRDEGTRSDMPLVNFFWDFFTKGKPCFVDIHYPGLEEMVSVIKDNSGIPVIAHIGANIKQEYTDVIIDMCRAGIMGVEVFSSYHSDELQKQLFDFCRSQSLFMTCGSDFHGSNKPKISIGSCTYNQHELAHIRKFTDKVTIY